MDVNVNSFFLTQLESGILCHWRFPLTNDLNDLILELTDNFYL